MEATEAGNTTAAAAAAAAAAGVVHSCDVCAAQFASRNALFRHIKSDHSEFPSTKKLKTSGPVSQQDTPGDANVVDNNSRNKAPVEIRTVQEDEWYRVIVKPQGLASMGSTGEETLFNTAALMIDCNRITYKKAVPCHRLDRETGGVMVCSKSKIAERNIMMCFRNHDVHKRYRAVLIGKLEPAEAVINTPVSEQESSTRYKVFEYSRSAQYGWITTVDLWPLTGRKHQLRKHMAGVGHPIIGDSRYSSTLTWPQAPFQFMFLWALEIDFPHPARYNGASDSNENEELVPAGEMEATTFSLNTTDTISASIPSQGAMSPDASISNNSSACFPERVNAQIDEPLYYGEFRLFHEAAYAASCQV
jgi:23S rRNA-/tRNA-specific pseudouridylate synthase